VFINLMVTQFKIPFTSIFGLVTIRVPLTTVRYAITLVSFALKVARKRRDIS